MLRRKRSLILKLLTAFAVAWVFILVAVGRLGNNDSVDIPPRNENWGNKDNLNPSKSQPFLERPDIDKLRFQVFMFILSEFSLGLSAKKNWSYYHMRVFRLNETVSMVLPYEMCQRCYIRHFQYGRQGVSVIGYQVFTMNGYLKPHSPYIIPQWVSEYGVLLIRYGALIFLDDRF